MTSVRFIVICLLLALGSGLSLAQNITGTILGTVTDASGAVVTGAEVTITNKATNQSTTVATDAGGLYQAPLPQPGAYQVRVAGRGFRAVVRDGVTLNVEDKPRLDFTLETGDVTATVTVTGTPLVQTESPSLGQVITERTVRELPIRGRSIYDLVGLSPNAQVSPLGLGGQGAVPGFTAFDISINGGRYRTNEFILDGVTTVLPQNNQRSARRSGSRRASTCWSLTPTASCLTTPAVASSTSRPSSRRCRTSIT